MPVSDAKTKLQRLRNYQQVNDPVRRDFDIEQMIEFKVAQALHVLDGQPLADPRPALRSGA